MPSSRLRQRDAPPGSQVRLSLELLAERAARAEEQRLDSGAERGLEDLEPISAYGAAFELAHDERGALVEAELEPSALRISSALGTSSSSAGARVAVVLTLQRDLLRAGAADVAEALPADVVGDLDQPVVRALAGRSPRAERAVGRAGRWIWVTSSASAWLRRTASV